VIISDNDVAIVIKQISTVWEKIHKRDFYKGCGKDYCYWCNFVKTNNLIFALHEVNNEEYDSPGRVVEAKSYSVSVANIYY
jgi:DNA helicase-2/ATP-dependent DNA helicase PcrA